MTRTTVFLTILLAALPAFGQGLQEKLDSLVSNDPLLETAQVGMMVFDLTADSTLYQMNHRQTLRPASTMKLLTAITALDKLGPDHRLRTALYYTGDIANGTLRGDVYCIGGMDPAFDGVDLQLFADCLTRLGVDTIVGRVVADLSMKDTLHWGEGWCWDDKNPTLTPLLVDKKDTFVGRLCRLLGESGVVMDSVTVATGLTPSAARYVCARNHTLGEVLVQMMKESDNLYAESVFYQLGIDRLPSRAQQCRAQMRQLISRLGLDAARYRVADGSGLSLYNYVSAELETMMLRHAWHTPRIYRALLPSLPIAGTDGTLKKRMQKTVAEGNVRAKTGTLTGVISLAGYCTAANGHQLCFAILTQGSLGYSAPRAFIDKACVLMCE